MDWGVACTERLPGSRRDYMDLAAAMMDVGEAITRVRGNRIEITRN